METNQQFISHRRSLRIVLVLSIIGSGMNLLSSIILVIAFPALQTVINSGEMTIPQELMYAYDMFLSAPHIFYACLAILYAMSLAGVILMWNIRKKGLHLYAVAQILLLIVQGLFLGRANVAIGDIMLTVLFVVFYVVTLHRIDAVLSQDNDQGQLPPGQKQE